MTSLFKKLNFKNQDKIFVLNSPDSFRPELDEMLAFTDVSTSLGKAREVSFVLAFVTKQSEVDGLANKVEKMLSEDGILWFAYPKGTSKKYKCEFNRDNGWTELGRLGFEPVRMVAIDEDWSALRFRKAEHIKTMSRSFAMSEKGKQKVAAAKKSKK